MVNYTVVGKARKVGTYNGRDYDNINLYCVVHDDFPVAGTQGDTVAVLKAKSESHIFDSAEVGFTYEVMFNQYGQPVSLNMIDSAVV